MCWIWQQRVALHTFSLFPFSSLSLSCPLSLSLSLSSALIFEFENLYLLNVQQVTNVIIFKIKNKVRAAANKKLPRTGCSQFCRGKQLSESSGRGSCANWTVEQIGEGRSTLRHFRNLEGRY